MPFLQVDDTSVPLRVGETRIGSGADADIRVATPDAVPTLAILELDARQATIRRAVTGAQVRVNGVNLGAEPSPLLHGDRIEVAGQELRFADDSKAGQTLVVPGLGAAPSSVPREPVAPTTRHAPRGVTRGRLVSLVDGREYAVPARGLRIGRDAASDVVVATGEVSRRHAEIVPSSEAYELRDTSTNGVWVNGERIRAVRALADGDVVRLGLEEFRFHADPAEGSGASAVPAPSDAATPAAVPSVPALPLLATLEILNEGLLKGRRIEVRRPLTHVGRGAHNDVVIADESVSDAHAKLQRREDGWVVVDMGSTNGTYVAGRRVVDEEPIPGAVDVRFGGIKMMFRPASPDGGAGAAHTRMIAAPRVATPASRPATAAEPRRGASLELRVAIVAALLLTLLYVLTAR